MKIKGFILVVIVVLCSAVLNNLLHGNRAAMILAGFGVAIISGALIQSFRFGGKE